MTLKHAENTGVATTNDLKNGLVLDLDGQLWSVVQFQHVKPGKGGAFVRTTLKNVLSGKVVDRTFNAGTKVETATVDKRTMTYLYREGDDFVFMDSETFEQVTLGGDMVGDKIKFLRENDTVKITFYDGKALDVELPQNVTLTVTETEPGIKGATAAAQTKPATLETGLIVQVPSFIAEGEQLVIQTEDGKYLKRAKEGK